MIYNLSSYRHTIRPVIQQWVEVKGLDKMTAGLIALSTNCPIVVVNYYIGELYGFTESLNNTIKGLEMFYKVEKIINRE